MPFGLHQAMEYLLAAVLVATALHSYGTAMGVMAAMGGLFALLAALSGPPLGGWKLLGRRAHHRADLALVAVVALSPLAPGRTTVWILVAESVAVVAWRLERSTRYEPAARRAGVSALDRLPAGARTAGFIAGRLAARVAERRRHP